MDKCSYFINNKALFGSSPTQEIVTELENLGVKYFVDLTCTNERGISEYTTKFSRFKFPIKDRSIPENKTAFCSFILKIFLILKNMKSGVKMYVHCKGGHGRSGVVVASLLCLYHNITPEIALEKTKEAHQQRKTMRDKWREIGSPQTIFQKNFVISLFKPILYHSNQYTCFNTQSSNSITIDNLGTFPTVEALYQAFKNPFDKNYLKDLQNPANDPIKLGKNVKLRQDKDWNKIKLAVMYNVLKIKFNQYPDHLSILINTYLRPIIKCSSETSYWCNMENNFFGRLLEKIRNEQFLINTF